jgi:hypothetical protein
LVFFFAVAALAVDLDWIGLVSFFDDAVTFPVDG